MIYLAQVFGASLEGKIVVILGSASSKLVQVLNRLNRHSVKQLSLLLFIHKSDVN